MKKIFMMLLILFIMYIGIQLGFRFFGSGHEHEYTVNNGDYSINIKEIFTNNTAGESDSYYFEINIDNTVFSYQTYENFNKSNQIIKDVRYYKDEKYRCILPIFQSDRILTDIMCLNDNIIYYYNSIEGHNKNIDSFAKSLSEYGYDASDFEDKATSTAIQGLTFYNDNYVDNHFLTIDTYKGIYTINEINLNKPKKIEIFEKDVYKREISTTFKNYYVVANYNTKYRFDKFYIIDLTTNKTKELDCEREISFDSYIQGTNNNSIYLFDRDSKKQYEINLKTNKVIEVGNENTGIKIYKNGEWEKISATRAKNNDIHFDSEYQSGLEDKKFLKIDKVGGTSTGYYYFYKKNGSEYSVYRSTTRYKDSLTYLFTTTDINRIKYHNNYVYYIYNDEVRYFSDQGGVKILLKDKELSFNKDLQFSIYIK